MKNRFEIFTFRAMDEPMLCAKYIDEHVKVLTTYGITNVSSNNNEWSNHPHTYCVMAQNLHTKQFVGGVRIQLSDKNLPLPIELALGHMDVSLKNRIITNDLNGRTAESCGLWVSQSTKGLGFARYLMRASISSSSQLSVKNIIGVSGWNTLQLFNEFGFVVDSSLGENGGFVYPTAAHIANVVEIANPKTLKNASAAEQKVMLLLRDKLELERYENKTNVLIKYRTKYPNITPSDYLTK